MIEGKSRVITTVKMNAEWDNVGTVEDEIARILDEHHD